MRVENKKLGIFHGFEIIFHLDNLEPAPGRPAPELEVKVLKMVMFLFK